MSLERIAETTATYATQGAQKTVDLLTKTAYGAVAVDLFTTHHLASIITEKGVVSKEMARNTIAFAIIALVLRTGGGSLPVTQKMIKTILAQTALKIFEAWLFSRVFLVRKYNAGGSSAAQFNLKHKNVSTILTGFVYFGLRSADIFLIAKNSPSLSSMLRANLPQYLKAIPGVSRFI